MDAWLIGAIIGLLALLIAGVMLAMSRRAAAAESYYGPLPERDADEAEVTDPTQFGQVTPGAVTPAAAGSPEQFYEQTGVGSEGPKHLSGPPSEASAHPPRPSETRRETPTPHHPSDGSWAVDERGGSRRLLLGAVAGAGASVGLGIFAFLRRRAQRQSRMERLKARARGAASVARGAAMRVRRTGEKAAALPETLPEGMDARTGAGGGVAALAVTMVLLAASRRRQRQAESKRLAAEAAAASEAARKGGLFGLKLGTDWLARQRERGNGAALVAKQAARPTPTWALVIGGAAFVAFGLLAARRGMRREPDWTGAMVADSAPGREPPASP